MWEKTERPLANRTVGFLYVYPAEQRPIICTKNDGTVLKEADIYYRYPGETRRIRYGELVQIFGQHARRTERQWADVLRRVEHAGVENVAILNTVTGEVSGRSGRFLIDEKLIPKLKFVAEGHFSETEGEPTLKLVGDVESMRVVPESRTVIQRMHLTDFDLMNDFINLNKIEDASMYIRHLAHSAKLWLPVYYYIRQVELKNVLTIIRDERSTRYKHIQKLENRIQKRLRPTGAPSPQGVLEERNSILNSTAQPPHDEVGCEIVAESSTDVETGGNRSKFSLSFVERNP